MESGGVGAEAEDLVGTRWAVPGGEEHVVRESSRRSKGLSRHEAHFKREARSPPRLVAPGASPGSLLGLHRAEWDGEPIPPPFSGKLLDGTWRLHSPTPPPLNPAPRLPERERVNLCWAWEANLGALEKGAVDRVMESCL